MSKLKALYVGKIQENKKDEFNEIMNSLAYAYNNTNKPKRDGDTCITYNYYTKEDYDINAINIENEDTKQEIQDNIQPAKWIKEWVERNPEDRQKCINIIDHMLDLSGFAEYLNDNDKKQALTANHDICCCVTYYDNRLGSVGFHQDSLGAELFVSLIYRDTVYGPELKLKEHGQFTKRITDICPQFMPAGFIQDMQELYNAIKRGDKDVVKWDSMQEEKLESFGVRLKEGKIEWIPKVQGPGGIVGFLDELFIHSTPSMEHRKPNGELLLNILSTINASNHNEETAIELLKAIIGRIKNEKGNYYITIDELKEEIQKDEFADELLEALYDKYEKEKLDEQSAEVRKNLELSDHETYDGANYAQFTGLRERAYSQSERSGTVPNIAPSDRRSFLRVWVIALPK